MFAIILVSFERGELTRRCIASLRETTFNAFHIYLIDNGSRDEATRSALREWEQDSDITLTRLDANLGPAAARNIGMQLARGRFRYFAMLDNDIVALPGWDEAARSALENHYQLIQPKLLNRDGRTIERGPNRQKPGGLAANPDYLGRGVDRDELAVNTEQDCEIVGTGIVMSSRVYEQINGMDERLHIGEDFDYSYRARAAGFRLGYVPDCEMIHDHGFDLQYEQERGRVEKYLNAHVILWHKHRKALLSPAYLHWYAWLHFHGEPMYLPEDRKWPLLVRRLRRRLARSYCMRKFHNEWRDEASVEQATRTLSEKLGIDSADMVDGMTDERAR